MPNHPLSEANYRDLRPDRPHHISPGAQAIGTPITLRLEGTRAEPEIVLTDQRRRYSWRVVMQATEQDDVWEADILLPDAVTIVTYHFVVDHHDILERRLVESYDSGVGNRPVYSEWQDVPYKIAVYDPAQMPPQWTQGMVIYQVFPDRFAKAQSDEQAASKMKGVYGHEPRFMMWGDVPENPPVGRDFYGGDLRGIIEKLDYIQSFGVECLYLNPIFDGPTNHRYETNDYYKIDQMLGTDADFDELVAEAHRRGMKIILDGVFNHCSSDSLYFDITGKFGNGASKSKQSPYYRWFKFAHWPHEYACWLGLGFKPELVESPEMVQFFLGADGVVDYWMKRGIDGWRIEGAFENTDDFWRRFRQRAESVNPETYMLAEEWRDATHYLLGDTFNAAMNYRFTWAVRGFMAQDYLNPSEFDDRLFAYLRDTPPPALHSQMILLDSHDVDRLITACGGKMNRFKQSVALMLAYPGAPSLYYGTETAIEGKFPEDSRRAMPWNALNEDLIAFFRQLTRLRKENPILRYGDVETVLIDDDHRTYAFARHYNGETLYAVFNPSRQTQTITLAGVADGTWADLLGNIEPITAQGGRLIFGLPMRGFVWLVKR